MALYQLTLSDVVIRTTDNVFIPSDPANRDRIAYAAWLALGNIPDPATPLVVDPFSNRIETMTLQVFFNHENRIRTLEGRATLTSSQFRAALVTLLGG